MDSNEAQPTQGMINNAQQIQIKQWIWGTSNNGLPTDDMRDVRELGHVSRTGDAHQVALENPRVACDVS